MVEKNAENVHRLVQRASEGDKTAFSELVAQYMNPIVALTYRMTGERETALDLAQDTFVSAWESLKQFRGDAKFESWLYRIAMNKALNFIAHRKIASPVEITEETAVASLAGPDDRLAREELRQRVLSFMRSLPEQQRAVFDLRFYRQLTFEEIAGVTGRAIGTVKTNYREAIAKLRQVAEDEGWRP